MQLNASNVSPLSSSTRSAFKPVAFLCQPSVGPLCGWFDAATAAAPITKQRIPHRIASHCIATPLQSTLAWLPPRTNQPGSINPAVHFFQALLPLLLSTTPPPSPTLPLPFPAWELLFVHNVFERKPVHAQQWCPDQGLPHSRRLAHRKSSFFPFRRSFRRNTDDGFAFYKALPRSRHDAAFVCPVVASLC